MKKLIVLASACMLLTSGVYAQSVKHAIKKEANKEYSSAKKEAIKENNKTKNAIKKDINAKKKASQKEYANAKDAVRNDVAAKQTALQKKIQQDSIRRVNAEKTAVKDTKKSINKRAKKFAKQIDDATK